MNEQERIEHNKLFAEVSTLVLGQISLHGHSELPKPGWLLRRKLRRALAMLHRVLELAPANWSAMWVAGKVHQRLGDDSTALSFFECAFEINPSQPDVAREASLCAMNLGRGDAAVSFALRATQIQPESAGLHANLALAYLQAGRVDEALKSIEHSLSVDPQDTISRTVRIIIKHFAANGRTPPKSTPELHTYWESNRPV